jgi:hypothetical protein
MTLAACGRALGKSPSCIFRWIVDGVRVGDHRVHLRSMRLGRSLLTTPRLVREFANACAPTAGSAPQKEQR